MKYLVIRFEENELPAIVGSFTEERSAIDFCNYYNKRDHARYTIFTEAMI